MNPRKNKPVLFELMSSAQRARGRVFGQHPETDAAAPPGHAPPSAAPTTGPSATPRARFWRYATGRVYLTLGWPHLAVLAAVLVILIVTAFQIGRRSGQPPAPKNTADLGELLTKPTPAAPQRSEAPLPTPSPKRSAGPVATPALPSSEDAGASKLAAHAPPEARETKPAEVKEKPKSKEAEDADSFNFAPSSYYVVVQHFRIRDRDRAVAAKEFLRSKGIACAIRPGGGDLELVATEAFGSEPAARDLVKRVLELGKEYWNSGGGYEFAGAKARKF